MKLILNIAQRQRKTNVQRHRKTDNLGRGFEISEWVGGHVGNITKLRPHAQGQVPLTLSSRNRRTQEWVEFILSQYRSPLVVLAETYSRSVEDLARELGCDKLEAFERQQAAAVALAPYLHSCKAVPS